MTESSVLTRPTDWEHGVRVGFILFLQRLCLMKLNENSITYCVKYPVHVVFILLPRTLFNCVVDHSGRFTSSRKYQLRARVYTAYTLTVIGVIPCSSIWHHSPPAPCLHETRTFSSNTDRLWYIKGVHTWSLGCICFFWNKRFFLRMCKHNNNCCFKFRQNFFLRLYYVRDTNIR